MPNVSASLIRNFHLAAWNHLYYRRDSDIGVDMPWVERMLQRLPEDSGAPPLFSRWRSWRTRTLYTLGDLMPFLTSLVGDAEIRSTIEETRCYFENCDGVSDRIRSVVKDTMRPLLEAGHEVLVVGHSLGSVIAFDALWEMSRRERWPWRVELLTLGSPLGMFYVQRRLLGRTEHGARRYPDNIRHWINIATSGDLTAVDRQIRDDFKFMLRHGLVKSIVDHTRGIYGSFHTAAGPNPHRCYGYFFNPVVADVIVRWLQGKPFAADL